MNNVELDLILKRYWLPKRVRAECSSCGEVLLDFPDRDYLQGNSSEYLVRAVEIRAADHDDGSEHDVSDVDVDIVPPEAGLKRDIDYDITVGQIDDE